MRIHILGGSGSGTTTIGQLLGKRLGSNVVESDDIYWLKTTPEYTEIRSERERAELLSTELAADADWIFCGSALGWSSAIEHRIDCIVSLSLPAKVRMERIQLREKERYGASVESGGDRFELSRSFLKWAARYDDEDLTVRSVASHREYIITVGCPHFEVCVDRKPEVCVDEIVSYLERHDSA